MAQKKKLGEKLPTDELKDKPSDAGLPRKYQELGWRDWLFHDVLRYWYMLGCIFIDLMVPLGLLLGDGSFIGVVLTIAFLTLAIPFEYLIYKRQWYQAED